MSLRSFLQIVLCPVEKKGVSGGAQLKEPQGILRPTVAFNLEYSLEVCVLNIFSLA